MRFQWALKWPNERERKNGIASSIRDTRTPLSDTFNNFNPWFNHERQDDLPSYKGLMWLLATLLRPTFFFPLLFSRSQIRTINSHGDGIQLKEAIPTSPLSGLSLPLFLSLFTFIPHPSCLACSPRDNRTRLIERRIEEISFTRMKTLPRRIHYCKNNLYLFLYRSDNELHFRG